MQLTPEKKIPKNLQRREKKDSKVRKDKVVDFKCGAEVGQKVADEKKSKEKKKGLNYYYYFLFM